MSPNQIITSIHHPWSITIKFEAKIMIVLFSIIDYSDGEMQEDSKENSVSDGSSGESSTDEDKNTNTTSEDESEDESTNADGPSVKSHYNTNFQMLLPTKMHKLRARQFESEL